MKKSPTNKNKAIKPKRKNRDRKSKNYVNNKELYDELVISKEQGELTKPAVEMLVKICNHCINRLSYKYEEDREDCIATAVMKCVLYWNSYKPEKSKNAFAYFSQVAKHAYAESFNKSKLLKTASANIISLSDDQIHLF